MNVRRIAGLLLNSDHVLFTFIRSLVGSFSSAVTDIGSRVLFYSLIFAPLSEFYRSNLAVTVGAVIGGAVQCMVNYKFTFHAEGQDVKAVAVKYCVVWGGNLLLNMYGTTLLARSLSQWKLLTDFGLTNTAVFAVATFGVAVLVSIFWNFGMQRYFVYRSTRFDRFAVWFANCFRLWRG